MLYNCLNLTSKIVKRRFPGSLFPAPQTRIAHCARSRSPPQAPLNIVHGDYTETSGPRRLAMLAEPPKRNDARQESVPGARDSCSRSWKCVFNLRK